jgi:hypothetical protein
MPQITARLSPEERRLFEEYATSLGLNGSSLARLLLARALGHPVRSLSPIRRKEKAEAKLTAHYCSIEALRRLRARAAASKMSPAEAAKVVFTRELDERWLAKAAGLSFKTKR